MPANSENIDRIKNILDYIEMHIKDEISLEDISKTTALNTNKAISVLLKNFFIQALHDSTEKKIPYL